LWIQLRVDIYLNQQKVELQALIAKIIYLFAQAPNFGKVAQPFNTSEIAQDQELSHFRQTFNTSRRALLFFFFFFLVRMTTQSKVCRKIWSGWIGKVSGLSGF